MRRLVMLGVGLAELASTPAWADEQYFGYVYSAEVLGKGQTEADANLTAVVSRWLDSTAILSEFPIS